MSFLSPEHKRQFTWRFGVIIAVFFSLQFVVPMGIWIGLIAWQMPNMRMDELVGAFEFKNNAYLLTKGMDFNRSYTDTGQSFNLFELENGRISEKPILKMTYDLLEVQPDSRGIWLVFRDRYDLFDGNKIVKTGPLKWNPSHSVFTASDEKNIYIVYVRRAKYWLATLGPGGELKSVESKPPDLKAEYSCACGDRMIFWNGKIWHLNITNREAFLRTITGGKTSGWVDLGDFPAHNFALAYDDKGLLLIGNALVAGKNFKGSFERGLRVARIVEDHVEDERTFLCEVSMERFAVLSNEHRPVQIFAQDIGIKGIKISRFELTDQGPGKISVVYNSPSFFVFFWAIPIMLIVPLLLIPFLVIITSIIMRRYRVTGVTLQNGKKYEYASVNRRALALAVDQALLLLPLVPLITTLRETCNGPVNPAHIVIWLSGWMAIWAILCLLYFAVLEGEYGLTVGKFFLGIRTLGDDGSPPGFGRALLRNIFRLFDSLFIFMVGIALIAYTQNWQRLGDLLARTVVVKKI